MALRVLIIDGATSVPRALGYALGALDYEVLPTDSAEEGLRKSVTDRPDLVIVETNLPDMTAEEVCRQLRHNPQTCELPIIMISDKAGVADRINGLKAGANEYVTKPLDVDEVVARVETLLDLTRHLRSQEPTESGRIISLIGAKGGVGTTTIGLNIAATLASQRMTAIAVELRNSFGTAVLQLGDSPSTNLSELLQLAPEDIDAKTLRDCVVRSNSGFGVLFGPQCEDEPREVSPEHAQAILKQVARMVAYTLVDLPCHLTPATEAALLASDYVIAVIEHEPQSWAAGRVLLAQLESCGVRHEQLGAVVKRSPSGRPLKASETSVELGCEILGVFPPADEACKEAQIARFPLVLSQGSTGPALALREITNKLTARFAAPVRA